MSCTHPGAVTSRQLMEYADGWAPADVVDHVRGCDTCRATVDEYARVQARLGNALQRFDCPSPQLLGDYELGLVDGEARTRIAAHLLDCPSCAAELVTLRSFLGAETAVGARPSFGDRLRRVVASLVPTPALAQAALRGGAPTSVSYRGDRVLLTVSVELERRRGATVFGLVVPDAGDASAIAGAPVRLSAGTRFLEAEVDEVGSFVFEAVEPGQYELALGLPDQVVVIEDLVVES